jgi:hypothetical protein
MSTTATTSAARPIKFELRRTSPTEAVVKLPSGEEYTFKVYKQTGTGTTEAWTDITGAKDWKDIAQHVSDLFYTSIESKPFETAEIVLTGDFADIEAETSTEKNVQLVTAKVTHREGAETRVTNYGKLETLPAALQPKIKEKLDAIGKDFKNIKPLSSDPRAPAEEFEMIDERMQICKGRRKGAVKMESTGEYLTTVDYALAVQAKEITRSDQSISNIVKHSRSLTSKYINSHLEMFMNDLHFADIFTTLKVIENKDKKTLEEASTHIKLSEYDRREFLGEDRITDPRDKAKLVNLYAAYIAKGGKILGNTYLNAFIGCAQTKGQKIQIVVIEGNGILDQRATSYPSSAEIIDPVRCAFLYFNTENKQYLPYEREANTDVTATEGAKVNLNETTKRLSSKPIRKPKSSTTLKTIDRGGGGKCLGLSLAHQLGVEDPEQFDEYLRTQAAEKIKEDSMSDDREFMNALLFSLQSIDPSERDIVDHIITNLHSTPEETHAATTAYGDGTATAEQKKLLRNFYAAYITYKSADTGPMKQNLDSAFLHVLPQIPVRRTESDRIGITQYKCAVFSGEPFVAKYPKDKALGDDFMFVYHDDHSLHYKSVDKRDRNTKDRIDQEKVKDIAAMKNEKRRAEKRILDELLTLSLADDSAQPPDAFKNRINNEIKTEHRVVFNTLATAMYAHDLKAHREDSSRPEPLGWEYGAHRLRDADPKTLKTAIASFVGTSTRVPEIDIYPLLTEQFEALRM